MLTPSRLVVARKRSGLTLTRLAELTGLSTHSLSVYENGHQAPSQETLRLLAGTLGVDSLFLVAPDVDEIPEEVFEAPRAARGQNRQRELTPNFDSRVIARFFSAKEMPLQLDVDVFAAEEFAKLVNAPA